MTELDHILDQIDRSFRGDAWHGPSVWEVLADIDAAKAGRVGEVDDATYWPAPPASANVADWQATLDELAARHQELLTAIASFAPNRLDEPLFASGSPAFNNFLGHAQHNANHAGQIALINSAAHR